MFLRTHQSALIKQLKDPAGPLPLSCGATIPTRGLWRSGSCSSAAPFLLSEQSGFDIRFSPNVRSFTAVRTGLLCSPCPCTASDRDSRQGFALVPSQPAAVNLFTSLSVGNLIQKKKCKCFLFFNKCMDFFCHAKQSL